MTMEGKGMQVIKAHACNHVPTRNPKPYTLHGTLDATPSPDTVRIGRTTAEKQADTQRETGAQRRGRSACAIGRED